MNYLISETQVQDILDIIGVNYPQFDRLSQKRAEEIILKLNYLKEAPKSCVCAD